MQRQRGFTIIELVIAISITFLLLAVALPRYTIFSRQQEFSGQAQRVVACIQQAHQTAVAPAPVSDGRSARFVGAIMTTNGTCTVQQLTANASVSGMIDGSVDANQNLVLSTSQPIVPESLHIVKAVINSQSYVCQSELRVYFGVLEQGAPVLFVCDNNSLLSAGPPAIPYGTGFTMSLGITNPNTETDIVPIRGIVSMARLGVPVHYDQY